MSIVQCDMLVSGLCDFGKKRIIKDLSPNRIAQLSAPCPSHKKSLRYRKHFNIMGAPTPTPGIVQ